MQTVFSWKLGFVSITIRKAIPTADLEKWDSDPFYNAMMIERKTKIHMDKLDNTVMVIHQMQPSPIQCFHDTTWVAPAQTYTTYYNILMTG